MIVKMLVFLHKSDNSKVLCIICSCSYIVNLSKLNKQTPWIDGRCYLEWIAEQYGMNVSLHFYIKKIPHNKEKLNLNNGWLVEYF